MKIGCLLNFSSFRRRRSRSPAGSSGRRRHDGDRDNPTESKVLGIFNLSLGSREETLQDVSLSLKIHVFLLLDLL